MRMVATPCGIGHWVLSLLQQEATTPVPPAAQLTAQPPRVWMIGAPGRSESHQRRESQPDLPSDAFSTAGTAWRTNVKTAEHAKPTSDAWKTEGPIRTA